MTIKPLSDTELMSPMIIMLGKSESTKANEGMAGIVRKQELLRRNIDLVLRIAKGEFTEDGRTIFSILERAYNPLNSGWSLIGKDGQIVMDFAKKVANLILHGNPKSQGAAANDPLILLDTTEAIQGRIAA